MNDPLVVLEESEEVQNLADRRRIMVRLLSNLTTRTRWVKSSILRQERTVRFHLPPIER